MLAYYYLCHQFVSKKIEDMKLLLGDEAVALGAVHAGISGVYAYPGTPSTEITEESESGTEHDRKNDLDDRLKYNGDNAQTACTESLCNSE